VRAHIPNALYGVLDYVAWPAGMLVVAPIALRSLGVASYGIWMFANAALATGSVIASGFGDANIRAVSMQRGTGDTAALIRAVRGTMGIHLALGAVFALLGVLLAPFAANGIAASEPQLRLEALGSLRIASLLILVRALETVCVSTQRAFESYGAAIGYSVLARLLSLAAVLLPAARHSVVALMTATAVFVTSSLVLQFRQLARLLHTRALWPSFDRDTARVLLGFGSFSWIQAVSGVAIAQADRLITGIYLGASAVAAYALCAQLAQPLYGIAASGLHFLFPYISARATPDSIFKVRRAILLSFAANFLMVAMGAGILFAFGDRMLSIWAGHAVERAGRSVLPLLVWGAAAQGLSITGAYTLLALGRIRLITLLNLAGSAAMLFAAPILLPRFGPQGMAIARLFYGPCALLVYVPLAFMLFRSDLIPSGTRSRIAVCREIEQ
jgi:O-antigen/teichoic acid export membrane protein